ncbi:hypothetical protein AiwAL_04940 [Acidiphilium sp. AL]|uniref:hypothetical protein n=1 Tax=Acidiphilium sp. AL TaxID=2871704 RepID=UPI0021CB0517|nr:hypothetical protein [Acidiphilium sp. AL]MCU4159450.1 hypothetical protein [Acidiphilium sp. AL]
MDDPLLTLKTLSNNTHYIRDFYYRMILGFTILLDIYIVGLQIVDVSVFIDFSPLKKIPIYITNLIIFTVIPVTFYTAKYLSIRKTRYYLMYNISIYAIFAISFMACYVHAIGNILETLPVGPFRLAFTYQYFFGVLCCSINAMYAFSKKYIYFLPNSMRNK